MSPRKHRLLKLAYLAELIFLAVPVLTAMCLLAAVGTVYCGMATLIGLSMLLENANGVAHNIDEAIRFVVLAPTGTMICLCGLAAIRLFYRVSSTYLSGSAHEFANCGRDFRKGLAFAAAPLMVMTGAAVGLGLSEPKAMGLLPFLSGTVVLVPTAHLGIALRKARAFPVNTGSPGML